MGKKDGQYILLKFFSSIIAVKIFHYRTKYYGAHKAADQYVEDYLKTADKFLEVYQGRYGRIIFSEDYINLDIRVLTDENIKTFLSGESSWIVNELNKILDRETDGDLYNIRDDLQSIIDQFKYLLTFK